MPNHPAFMNYAYVRYSDKRQAAGDSIRRQTDRVTQWQDEQERATGARPHVEYLQHSGSAHRGKNKVMGALADFLRRLDGGEIEKGSTLLLENLDRLSREHHAKAQRLFLDVVDSGVTLVTLHNGKSYRAPLELADTLVAVIEMDLAYQESAKKSLRVREAWSRAISERRLASAMCPPWLTRVKTGKRAWRYEPIPERVKLLRRIFQHLAANHGRGTYELTNRFNEEKLAPWNPKAPGWYSSFLEKLRSNRAALGEYQPRTRDEHSRYVPNGEPIQDFFPRVIDDATFAAAQRPGRTRGRPSLTEHNLLRGLAKSAVDGSPMIHRHDGSKWDLHYLISRDTLLRKTKPGHRVRYDRVEAALLAACRGAVKTPKEVLTPATHASEERAKLTKELALVQKQASRVTDALAKGGSLNALVDKLRELQAREESIIARKKALAVVAVDSTTVEDLESEKLSTPDQRRTFRETLARVAEEILVHADGEVELRLRGWSYSIHTIAATSVKKRKTPRAAIDWDVSFTIRPKVAPVASNPIKPGAKLNRIALKPTETNDDAIDEVYDVEEIAK